tara:strand:+ start:165 stop:590 length:426 start_codon:yes stop_codon:yes gene_type:complete
MNVTRIAGRKIVNAKKGITITVSKKDVAGADIKAPDRCAMARACQRQLDKEARIHVSRVYISRNGGTWIRYLVPENLRAEIIAFDRGGHFLPGKYQLYAPTPSRRTGKAQGTYHLGNNPNAKPRKKPIQIQDIRTGPANGV